MSDEKYWYITAHTFELYNNPSTLFKRRVLFLFTLVSSMLSFIGYWPLLHLDIQKKWMAWWITKGFCNYNTNFTISVTVRLWRKCRLYEIKKLCSTNMIWKFANKNTAYGDGKKQWYRFTTPTSTTTTNINTQNISKNTRRAKRFRVEKESESMTRTWIDNQTKRK